MIVVSQTPLEALEREWEENGMTPYVGLIAGQEHGTKAEHIQLATEGKGYGADRILMVGDAPGDYKAAAENLLGCSLVSLNADAGGFERFCLTTDERPADLSARLSAAGIVCEESCYYDAPLDDAFRHLTRTKE